MTSESEILTNDAREFLCKLHRQLNDKRLDLLEARHRRAQEMVKGKRLDFLPETAAIRERQWEVAPAPADLQDRRVEITGPAEPKMIINAMNSAAKVFMADFEDALSPSWKNLIEGQKALKAAVRRALKFEGENGKTYELKAKTATLVIRPRGLHFSEPNFIVDDEPISGSLFDFGLYFFHNAKELLARQSGPYFYLPKMESHLEARWWNEAFVIAQKELGIANGSIRATCLIETIPAAFEMDEFLYELRDHSSGLNAGRWDYIFSFIKKHHADSKAVLPDRAQVTMTIPMMQSYCELLVKTCHRRNAHAIGGMSAFIPNRREPEVTARAIEKVHADKKREAGIGFDGTWVAHPDLVAVAEQEFNAVLGARPHQKSKKLEVNVTAEQLLNPRVDGGAITEAGVRGNINVALLYVDRWLAGVGAAALHNLMEDAATAEISRSQLWQWVHHRATLASGTKMTAELYSRWQTEEAAKIKSDKQNMITDFGTVESILSDLVLNSEFAEFLTTKSYSTLRQRAAQGGTHG